MTFTLPRTLWADNGETPTMLVEQEWDRFFLVARDSNSIWKVMSAPMTAHDAKNPYAKRLAGFISDWEPVEPTFNTWLNAEYTATCEEAP